MDAKLRGMTVLVAWAGCAALFVGGCGLVPVPNPDYQAWAEFEPGAYVVLEGTQKVGDEPQDVRITDKLIKKDIAMIVLERIMKVRAADGTETTQVLKQLEPLLIFSGDNAMTHPWAKRRDLGTETIKVAGRDMTCKVQELELHVIFKGFFEEAEDVHIKTYRNPDIPGGMAKGSFQTKTQTHSYELQGRVVEYKAVRKEKKE